MQIAILTLWIWFLWFVGRVLLSDWFDTVTLPVQCFVLLALQVGIALGLGCIVAYCLWGLFLVFQWLSIHLGAFSG